MFHMFCFNNISSREIKFKRDLRIFFKLLSKMKQMTLNFQNVIFNSSLLFRSNNLHRKIIISFKLPYDKKKMDSEAMIFFSVHGFLLITKKNENSLPQTPV